MRWGAFFSQVGVAGSPLRSRRGGTGQRGWGCSLGSLKPSAGQRPASGFASEAGHADKGSGFRSGRKARERKVRFGWFPVPLRVDRC